MNRAQLFDFFLLALLGLILLGMGFLFSPFLGAFLGAVLLGVLFYPWQERLRHWMPHRSASAHAAIMSGVVLGLLVLPLVGFGWGLANESDRLAPQIKEWREGRKLDDSKSVRHLGRWLHQHWGVKQSLFHQQLMQIVNAGMDRFSGLGVALASRAVGIAVHLTLMMVFLFFVFRDGKAIYQKIEKDVPLDMHCKIRLRERMSHTLTGVVRGWWLTALIQGVVASLAYAVVGLPAVLILGLLTAFVGLIPMVGTALVWVPISLVLMAHGDAGKAAFILGWGVLVVSMIDNVLRPYLMGRQAHIPFFYLFFALWGGVEIWGLKGIVLGPLLVGVAPALVEVYRHRFLESRRPAPIPTSVQPPVHSLAMHP